MASGTREHRTTTQKLAIFRTCFSGLDRVYGTYNPKTGQVTQVKQPVTDQVMLAHLLGRRPYGVYLLTGETTRAVVADFDLQEPDPAIHFVRQADHYGIQAYIERSKRKGWHAWIFTDSADVSAAKARLVVKAILADIGAPYTEVFPKQDKLSSDTTYGNFINAPLPRSLNLSTYRLQDLALVGDRSTECYTVRDIWDMIVTNAHATGEPGICFIDRVNRDNPTPALGRIEATNPCGEQPLLPSEACNLGSINVARFALADESDLKWDALQSTVTLAVRFLDDVIDANHYPVPQIAEATRKTRKIGLGIMGLADALIKKGLPYDSDAAVAFAGKLCQTIQAAAHTASQALAERRGCFPAWEGSIWDTQHHRPMRNACCTTIAPTGSVSIIAGCSSGIEPIFSLSYRRRALDGCEFDQIHPLLEKLGQRDGWLTKAVRKALSEGVPATEIDGIPLALAEVAVTAHEIHPDWHVRMQAAVQQHLDNAVSKTVNLSAYATVADIERAFRQAFALGCKGITVYRDASRSGQTFTKAENAKTTPPTTTATVPRVRGSVTEGKTYKFRMGCGTLFVTVNRDQNGLCEVFANLGKAGGCPSQSEATCRAVSAALRSGVRPEVLIEQLRGIRCMSTCTARKENGDIKVLSCPDAIARAIEMATASKAEPAIHYESAEAAPPATAGRLCPRCQHLMRKDAGCLVCDRCLHSSCA